MDSGEAWQLTEAGLLKEAGIYQHYATAMPAEAVSHE